MRQSTVDESIKQPFQTLDMMCFSSQFFFIATIHSWGMIMCMFGITVMMRNQHNMFGDPMVLFIACIVWYLADIVKYLLVLLGRLCRVWRLRVTEGSIDDELAKRLAVGEDNKDLLEQARLELRAMNSERFRHRFLERSKPWILQHLEELLTPRTQCSSAWCSSAKRENYLFIALLKITRTLYERIYKTSHFELTHTFR